MLSVATHRSVAAPGAVEAAFDPNANSYVTCTAIQTDGKIVIGGDFTTVGGVVRNRIARLNADGTLDATFNPNVGGGSFPAVLALAVQADGKIVLGGQFSTVGPTTRNRIARLNADGTLDTTFNPNASAQVYCLGLQADGKILVGGAFSLVGGDTRNCFARLNATGALDGAINPGVNSTVVSMALQTDGKVVIGGFFTTVAGVARTYAARLNADLTLDASFNPAPNNYVYCVAVQTSGQIPMVGQFTSVGGVARSSIARVDATGALDASFNPGANNTVLSLAVQTDGKMVVAGYFTVVGSIARSGLARLNLDGTLDALFNPGAADYANVTLQADGKIVVAGGFTTVGGVARNRIARLENDAVSNFLTVPNAGRVQWLRGGASPEAPQTTFELSVDGGSAWTPLGTGFRIAGGWNLAGLSLPTNGHIRARARTAGGEKNSSASLLQSVEAFSFETRLPKALTRSIYPPNTVRQAGVAQGSSVAVDGGFAVVGAPYDHLGGNSFGAARVYDTVTGQRLHILAKPGAAAGEVFGWSVAVSGSLVVVGDPERITGAINGGSAYVYDLAGATPTIPVFTLNNPSPAATDRFGYFVQISGSRVVVGAPYDDAGATDAGSVYVYDLAGATPTVPAVTLTKPGAAANDLFGWAVAISGTKMIVGAPFDDTGAADAGSAFVYDLGGGTPDLPIATLRKPGPSASDHFGIAVAIAGSQAVVGARYDDTGATDAGSAYLYDLSSATPEVPTTTFHNPGPGAGEAFGRSVGISGLRVIVAAPYDLAGAIPAGSTYVYDLTSATPTIPVATLNNPAPAADDRFGISVGISGANVLVGANLDDTTAPDAGSA